MNIGIIGFGFVGSAVGASYDNVLYFDPFKNGSVKNLSDLLICDAIFVCVPTPSLSNGKCDVRIIYSSLQFLTDHKFNKPVICKSTAPYSVYERFSTLKIAFIPEFLRANSAVEDYLATQYMIVGCNSEYTKVEVSNILNGANLKYFNRIIFTSIKDACLIKYFENSFLATKVSLMNEFKHLTDKVGGDWENVIYGLTLDPRIGPDHTQVPGPDGKYGWGGHCFPKDTSELIVFANNNGVKLTTLEAAVDSNVYYRHKDD